MNDKTVNDLIQRALEARRKSYSPYSSFAVGAALLTKSGAVYAACNVENASFGLTVCAERAAVFKAVSEGETHFVAIAIAADAEHPVPPCGACRQVLAEFGSDILVIMANTRLEKKKAVISDLLPDSFRL